MKEFVFSFTSFWKESSSLTKVLVVSILASLTFLGFFIQPKKEKSVETKIVEEKKGFELFDSHTWIKGEKELQILEMRALKGQLEKDIAKFEHIQEAHLIIDLPSQKSFGASTYPTKASIILALKAGTKLTPSCIKAITSHLAGAIRGLEPAHIAISDTKGRLYQSLDGTTYAHEEEVFQAPPLEEKSPSFMLRRLFILIPLILIACGLPLFFLFKGKKDPSQDLTTMMNKVSLKALSSMIQNEPPSTIAMMLSYLSNEKREALLKELPQEIKLEILSHLPKG